MKSLLFPGLVALPLLALAPPEQPEFGSPFASTPVGPWPKTGKGQGHGRPERNARKAKRRQRAKARR
jgi:hypothetical protein